MKVIYLIVIIITLIIKNINSQFVNFWPYQTETCGSVGNNDILGIGYTFVTDYCIELFGNEGPRVWAFKTQNDTNSITAIEYEDMDSCENGVENYSYTLNNGTCIFAINFQLLNGSFTGECSGCSYSFYTLTAQPSYPPNSQIYENYDVAAEGHCSLLWYKYAKTYSNKLFLIDTVDNGGGSDSSDGFSSYTYNYYCEEQTPYVDTCVLNHSHSSYDCTTEDVYLKCGSINYWGHNNVFCN